MDIGGNKIIEAPATLEATSYPVYTTESIGGGEQNHIAIFVETGPSGRGRTYHVTGNILVGMTYQARNDAHPSESCEFITGSLKLLGTVAQTDMARLEAICESIEVPSSQLFLNGKRKDSTKPLRRCTEWVQDAQAQLVADGIVK